MRDPILYLALILALTGIFTFISLFETDDDDDNNDGHKEFLINSLQLIK